MISTRRRARSWTVAAVIAALAWSGTADAQRKHRGTHKGKRPATTQDAEPAATPDAEPVPTPAGAEPDDALGEGADAAAQASPQDAADTQEPEAAEPAPAGEADAPEAEAPPPAVDLGPLRAELAAVMDELVQARARVAVLGKALFKTRARVTIQNLAGDTQRVGRVMLRLDGAPIYSAEAGALSGDEETQVFEGFVAPGPHTLVVEIEQLGRDDDEYRYGLRDSFRFQLPRERSTELRLVLDDDSDMAEDFADDEEGEYDVRTRLKVRAHPIGED